MGRAAPLADGECVIVVDPLDFPELQVVYRAQESNPSFAITVLNPANCDLYVIDDDQSTRRLDPVTRFRVVDLRRFGRPFIHYEGNSDDRLSTPPADTTNETRVVTARAEIDARDGMIREVHVLLERQYRAVVLRFVKVPRSASRLFD